MHYYNFNCNPTPVHSACRFRGRFELLVRSTFGGWTIHGSSVDSIAAVHHSGGLYRLSLSRVFLYSTGYPVVILSDKNIPHGLRTGQT